MPIYQTAHYQVNEAAVEKVNAAIEEFVQYVQHNEPGTKLYAAWQQEDDPTRFVHLFILRTGPPTPHTAGPAQSGPSRRSTLRSSSAAR